MLSREQRVRTQFSLALDGLLLAAAVALSIQLVQHYGGGLAVWLGGERSGMDLRIRATLLDYLLGILTTLGSLRLVGYYRLEFFSTFTRRTIASLKAVGLALAIAGSVSLALPMGDGDRLAVLLSLLGFFILHTLKNYLHRSLDRRSIHSGITSNCLLVTSSAVFREDAAALQEHQFRAVNFCAVYFVDQPDEAFLATVNRPYATTLEAAKTLIKQQSLELITLRFDSVEPQFSESMLKTADELGLDVWFFTDILLGQGRRFEVDHYMGLPMIVYRSADMSPIQLGLKRLLDIVASGLAIVALLPGFLLLALLIKLDSKGPIFFVQERSGLRGKGFRMFKFRTMTADAEAKRAELLEHNEMSGPIFKVTNDPRITGIGKFLRKYSLDEFPQLINVFRGEMSLVGPRPLPVHETMSFPQWKDRRRLSVKPGMTGLWQVSGRSDCSDFDELIRLDLKYIDTWNLLLDLEILLKTIPAVLTGRGAK